MRSERGGAGRPTCCWMRLQKYFWMSSRLEAACSSRPLCRAWGGGTAEESLTVTLSRSPVLPFRSLQPTGRRQRDVESTGHWGTTGRVAPATARGTRQGGLHRCVSQPPPPQPCLEELHTWRGSLLVLRGGGAFVWFWFWFLLCHEACRISAPGPGMGPAPPALEAPSLNHWTVREVTSIIFF